ncbi:DUF423 domain-containing protein [Limnohabitans radicicola]|uniref:DUF423 domain-containing protein n=1 Tax=Limnohabitans radicicola TaxID=2771427 RepID=A0A927FGZ8_9BURK|nr:DUF423 domain-containing protein [Limnohabitans radicicola]MBD8051269.1 DUF423 domain-containing protein [Limnohabitans radicicola]
MSALPVQARVFIVLGALSAASSVALSAAAAHLPALQAGASTLTTALAQQQFHALGLILVGLLTVRVQSPWLTASGGLMLAGTLLFCLNLYARLIWGWDAARAAVPWGGSAFILSWLSLGLGVWLGNRRH